MKERGIHWGKGKMENKDVPPPEEEKTSTEILVKEPSVLEVVENRIYFYAEINRSNILKLHRSLRETANNLLYRRQVNEVEFTTPIFLHISSYGGNLLSGLAALDEILSCPVDVNTIVDGCCASAATFLSVAGKKRLINKHAYMMIHQLSSMMWGTYSEFQDEMQNLDKFMKMIKQVYKEFTKVPMKKLDEILKHDLWFSPDTCLEYGLVDEIL